MKKLHPLATAVILATAAQAATADELSGLVLEEIVVTAQKREQSLQDVPVAVTAFDAQALKEAGVQEVSDLNSASPSFNINIQQNKVSNSPLRVRGIGTAGTNPAFEGAVGLYVDGVYRSRPAMVLSTFNDIGGLEILRGPQGTLFGKNTSAGALTLRSQAPGAEDAYGFEAQLGNYDKKRLSAYANVVVSDSVILRASALTDTRDGFYENPVTGVDQANIDTQSIKLQAVLTPTDELSIHIIADYSESEERCCYGFSYRLNQANPVDDFVGLAIAGIRGVPFYDAEVEDRDIFLNQDGNDESEDQGIGVTVDYDINDDMSLKSITSYREYTNDQVDGDADFGPLEILTHYNQLFESEAFSQEFNLTGNWGDHEYILGAFYSSEDVFHNLDYRLGSDLELLFETLGGQGDGVINPDVIYSDDDFDQSNEVMALFGHFTFAVAENVNAIVGLRYSEEEKEMTRTAQANVSTLGIPSSGDFAVDVATFYGATGNGLAFFFPTSGPDLDLEVSDEELTYTAGLQYFLDNGTQFYATFATGFKAGGISFNNQTGGGDVRLASLLPPEALANATPTAVPGVVLTEFTEPTYDPETVESFEFGVKAEYLEGRGRINVAAFHSEFEDLQVNNFTGTAFVTTNVGTAETQGLEIENTFVVTESLTSHLALTYMSKSEFGNDSGPNSGREQAFAPDLAATLRLNFAQPVGDGMEFYSNLNVSSMGSHLLSNDVDLKDSYTLFDLAVGLRSEDGTWDWQIACQNCADELYYTNAFNQPLHAAPFGISANPLMVNVGAPRTVVGTLNYNF